MLTHHMRRGVTGALLAGVLSLIPIASAAPAAEAAPPGAPYHKQCATYLFSAHSSRTFSGRVYTSQVNSLMQYWVRTRNANALGWTGSVTANGRFDQFWLRPFGGSRWTNGPAMFPANPRTRAHWYTVTVSPYSDASAVTVEIWAPRCS